MWPQISGILDFGFGGFWILDLGISDFGFWILGILDFGDFWILDFGDFGCWILGILDFGPLCSKSLCEAPNAPNLGDFGFWILGILGILGILDFGDFGFWILGILDFGVWGFWILDFVTNFGFYIRRRRLCTPSRVGGFSTRFWKIGRLRASNHREQCWFPLKSGIFFHFYGFCGGFCLFSQIAGVNLLMALKLPGQVYDEGNFFPKEEPWDATFGLDPKRWSVSGWKASQILPVIYVARDLEFINVYNLFEPSIQRSIQ